MEAIKVMNLSKEFKYYIKEEGLRNSITNLFKRKSLYKNAVSEISFSVEEGEIVAFLGPNGAGKTTTLKVLSGILYPTDGNAKVLGYVPWERKKEFKRQISIVAGQKSQLWWDLPAIESFYLNKCIYELDDKQYRNAVEELSTLLEVKDLLKIQVRRLSLGERMKMELIAALLHRPKVLFLDEPTIGLDIISQKNIRDFLKHNNETRKTSIILTSHYLKDIEDLCSRSIIINKGKLVYDGKLSNIDNTLGSLKRIKVEFVETVSEESIKKIGTIKEYNGFSATIEVNKDSLKLASQEILKFNVLDFNVEDIPLEESISMLFKKGGEIGEQNG